MIIKFIILFIIINSRFGSKIAGQKYANNKLINSHPMQIIQNPHHDRPVHRLRCHHHVAMARVVMAAILQSLITIVKRTILV